MPVQRSSITTSSNARKSIGFSINDIIKNDDSSKISSSNPSLSSSYLHPTPSTWLPPLPPPPTSLDPLVHYQFQRESALQYLRHSGRLFDGRFTSPEAAAALILHSFRKPKRVRTAFTPAQLLKLEKAFEKNHYVVGQERKELARHLNLTETQVKVWYQNRRTKHKRLKSEDGNSSPNGADDDDDEEENDDHHHVSRENENHNNESESTDVTNNVDDDRQWSNESHECSTTRSVSSFNNHHQHYPFISRSSTTDRYYLHLAAAAAVASENQRQSRSRSSSR